MTHQIDTSKFRPVVPGSVGWIFAGQLILSQPGRAGYAPTSLQAPLDSQTTAPMQQNWHIKLIPTLYVSSWDLDNPFRTWSWFDTSKFLLSWKPHNCKNPGDFCTNSTHTSLFGCHVKSTCDQKVPIFFLWHLLFYFKLTDYQSVLIKHAYCFLLIFFEEINFRKIPLRYFQHWNMKSEFCFLRGCYW